MSKKTEKKININELLEMDRGCIIIRRVKDKFVYEKELIKLAEALKNNPRNFFFYGKWNGNNRETIKIDVDTITTICFTKSWRKNIILNGTRYIRWDTNMWDDERGVPVEFTAYEPSKYQFPDQYSLGEINLDEITTVQDEIVTILF